MCGIGSWRGLPANHSASHSSRIPTTHHAKMADTVSDAGTTHGTSDILSEVGTTDVPTTGDEGGGRAITQAVKKMMILRLILCPRQNQIMMWMAWSSGQELWMKMENAMLQMWTTGGKPSQASPLCSFARGSAQSGRPAGRVPGGARRANMMIVVTIRISE